MKDFISSGIKIARDHTPDMSVTFKGPKSCLVLDQGTNGVYQIEPNSLGDEAGWGVHKRISPYPPAWTQALPAILDPAEGTIRPIQDKSLAFDPYFLPKTISSSPGDSADTVRVAEKQGEKVPGLLVACINHESREYIFFPLSASESVLLAIRDNGDSTGTPVVFQGGGWIESGEKKSLITCDPGGWYGNKFKAGNIYVGLSVSDKYLVSRYGYGDIEKTFTCDLPTGHKLKVDVDGQGSVVNVRVE